MSGLVSKGLMREGLWQSLGRLALRFLPLTQPAKDFVESSQPCSTLVHRVLKREELNYTVILYGTLSQIYMISFSPS